MMVLSFLNSDCPVWPCEAIIVLISVVVGGIIGFFLGRRGGPSVRT